ncbi:MAG: hypothetical protein KBS79_00870 [Lachnospiraceae bacterium]|nr:hypothetical protein [Candidatus Minthocola equi]
MVYKHEHPELDGYPEIITPDVFGEIDNLRNAVFSYHMNDYTFVAEDGTKYHVNIAYHAWSAFQLDNNDKTIDWHDKATDALIKMIKDSFDYDTKKPEVIEYDPSLFSEDLNYCYKDSAVTFVTADGDLMYSYVNGKLSCIWFYACDTLYEIYINFDENYDATGTSEWIQSLEGWLSDLASVETAPKAAAKLRQIAEDSWQIRYDYIHSLPEWEEDYIALRKPRDWYKKSEE